MYIPYVQHNNLHECSVLLCISKTTNCAGVYCVVFIYTVMFSEVKQIVGLRLPGLHIQGRLMKDRWADSGQWTFGNSSPSVRDSLAPQGPIICHQPWDLSVQPATAVLPQLWIIGHVRRHQTTLSSPVLQPMPRGTSSSLSHTHMHVRACAYVHICTHTHTHTHTCMFLWTVMRAGLL